MGKPHRGPLLVGKQEARRPRDPTASKRRPAVSSKTLNLDPPATEWRELIPGVPHGFLGGTPRAIPLEGENPE